MNKFAINNFSESVEVLDTKFGEVTVTLGE